jgi:hypothetical protein
VLFGPFLLIVRFLSGLFGVLYLELVDCAFRVAYIYSATFIVIVPGPVAPIHMGVSLACTM